MEIHSSSLTNIPATFKTKNSEQTQQHPIPPQNSDTSVISRVEQHPDSIEHQQSIPAYSHSARAVNAYIYENARTLKNEQTASISSIDIFA